MDYRQLVNETIKASGASLDALTVGNFGTTTEPLQVKFKEFVAQAWRELQMERGEWEFTTQTGVAILSPRFYIELGDRATAPPVGSTYVGTETGAEFEVIDSTSHILSGSWAAGTAKVFLDVHEMTGVPKLNESFDELTPTIANTDVFVIRDWGKYDLSSHFTGFNEPILDTVFIQSTGGSTVQTNSSASDLTKLEFVEYSKWSPYYETGITPGTPRAFTVTPDGYWTFWPKLDEQYLLKLSYISNPDELSAHDDTPDLPTQYQWAIVWKAVMLWAQYDARPQDEARAMKNYKFYKRQLDRYYKPSFSWAESKFNG